MAQVYKLAAKCPNEKCGEIVRSDAFPSVGVQRAFDPDDWIDVMCPHCDEKFKAKFGQLLELPFPDSAVR